MGIVIMSINSITNTIQLYRPHIDTIVKSQQLFLVALQNITTHRKLTWLSFSDESVHELHAQCMHYLHKYINLYSVEEASVDHNLMLVAVLSLSLKVAIS